LEAKRNVGSETERWKRNGTLEAKRNVGSETEIIGNKTETLEMKRQKAKKTEKVLSPLTNTQDSSFIGNP